MPWRKRWIDPGTFEGQKEELEAVLAQRAYEVWVSEISECCFTLWDQY
jgi:A/G-specific adenine glycosylase